LADIAGGLQDTVVGWVRRCTAGDSRACCCCCCCCAWDGADGCGCGCGCACACAGYRRSIQGQPECGLLEPVVRPRSDLLWTRALSGGADIAQASLRDDVLLSPPLRVCDRTIVPCARVQRSWKRAPGCKWAATSAIASTAAGLPDSLSRQTAAAGVVVETSASMERPAGRPMGGAKRGRFFGLARPARCTQHHIAQAAKDCRTTRAST